jgi:hypothetical protein
LIPRVSAALSRILRPIRSKPKGSGESLSTQSGADTYDHENGAGGPIPSFSPPDQSSGQSNQDRPEPQVSPKGEAAPIKAEDIGLTRVILEMRQQTVVNDNGDIAAQYESSSREQKSGSKLPKGSMVDRKAG